MKYENKSNVVRTRMQKVKFGSVITVDFVDFYLMTPSPSSMLGKALMPHNLKTGYPKEFDWDTECFVVE